MSDRRSSHHHHHHHHPPRQSFEDKYRLLENELKRKNDAIDSLRYARQCKYSPIIYYLSIRNETIDTSNQNDLSRSSCNPAEQSVRDNFLY